MRDLLAAGVRSGEFDIPDVQLTAIATPMMCSGVSDWFEHRGRLGPGKIAKRYAEMAVRLVTRRGPAAATAVRFTPPGCRACG